MIIGSVTAANEAVIQLVVIGPKMQHAVEGVIDTGFSGDVTLPASVITSLGLTWLGREAGILADGSTDLFEVYSAIVLWDSKRRSIEVQAANTQPLIGMNLLHRHSVYLEVIDGGRVEIEPLT
jgi:clan AA aspartic protease